MVLAIYRGAFENDSSVFVSAEIVNHMKVENLVVPRGNYTQIRMSGFGYGDSSLENDIS